MCAMNWPGIVRGTALRGKTAMVAAGAEPSAMLPHSASRGAAAARRDAFEIEIRTAQRCGFSLLPAVFEPKAVSVHFRDKPGKRSLFRHESCLCLLLLLCRCRVRL